MNRKVRAPYAAGKFFTDQPEQLRRQIAELKKQAEIEVPVGGCARAVILPHAGYDYSAATAVKTLVSANAAKFQRFLLLAPSHRVPFRGVAWGNYHSYRTPLGEVPVNTAAAEQLALNQSLHLQMLNTAHEGEHSLEVELPLLQVFQPEMSIIPLIAGFIDTAAAEHLAIALAEFWQPDILWIISSDFTHYGASFNYLPFREHVRRNLHDLDGGAIRHILDFDLHGFNHYIGRTGATICGAGPIRILLAMARQAIANGAKLNGELTEYITSGDLTGDYSHCVSYAGIVIRETNSEAGLQVTNVAHNAPCITVS